MAKVIFPPVHYQTSHVVAPPSRRRGRKGETKKNLLRRGRLGKTAATCIISKGKQNNDGITGLHKVALRNSPAARCLLFAARLPYIIKAGICICLHSVAS